ncbi:MAG: hypothetical protein OEY11_14900 [Gammaproteobacteria bacterium]|nr:hypothetical protein [Gammaproteobacteria bacterium]
MSGLTVYVFHFADVGDVKRIPYAKWDRILTGNENIEKFSGCSIYIAYAYLMLENKKPDYCPRIDGAIYCFDDNGRVISDSPHYFDLLQDLDETTGDVINLQHHKNKMMVQQKYHWKLNTQQIQLVIELIWKYK